LTPENLGSAQHDRPIMSVTHGAFHEACSFRPQRD
jgi:hypothetical protein